MANTVDRLCVRTIAPHELHTFTLVSRTRNDPMRHAELAEHLAERWAGGLSRPEWCFVAEEGGEIVGRIGYWNRPRVSPDTRFVNPLLLDLPWGGDYRRIGSRLLSESMAALREEGAEVIDMGIDCPTDADALTARRVAELLLSHGWECTRETLRFDLNLESSVPLTRARGQAATSSRLTYRPIEEVGDEAFIAAFARAIEGTLDQPAKRAIEREGTAAKARGSVASVRRLVRDAGWRVDEGWWQLGYTEEGALAGFVMPAVNASGDGVIWWIGVLPERRGHRYVDDLLTLTAKTLCGAGVKRIVADTDIENRPMAAAFERGGWRRFATSATYEVRLG